MESKRVSQFRTIYFPLICSGSVFLKDLEFNLDCDMCSCGGSSSERIIYLRAYQSFWDQVSVTMRRISLIFFSLYYSMIGKVNWKHSGFGPLGMKSFPLKMKSYKMVSRNLGEPLASLKSITLESRISFGLRLRLFFFVLSFGLGSNILRP